MQIKAKINESWSLVDQANAHAQLVFYGAIYCKSNGLPFKCYELREVLKGGVLGA